MKSICPNCGVLSEGDVCPFCGTPEVRYEVDPVNGPYMQLPEDWQFAKFSSFEPGHIKAIAENRDSGMTVTVDLYPKWMQEQQEEDGWYSTEVD